jgi:hypothetical protein
LSQDGEVIRAARFEIGVGSEQGWETAVCDHFRAVATAIAAKVTRPGSSDADEVGGGTLSFRVNEHHPFAADVYALLRETRERANALWAKVAAHNDAQPTRDEDDRVTFYFGQNVVRGAEDAGVPVATGVESAEVAS